MSYLRRQAVTSVLIANAVRPAPGMVTSVPAMFGGWLVTELAPHFIAGTAIDTALELGVRQERRGSRRGAVLGLANMAALGYLMREGRRSGRTFEETLVEGLGSEALEDLHQRYGDLDWVTPLRELVWPFHTDTSGIQVVKNVPYAPEHKWRGLLDVYKPQGEVSGAPVLLQIHGGGWTIGNKEQQGLPLMRHLTSRGWVCVSINYRLAPRSEWPAQIVDVKRAIAWIREHIADYGGDPDFLAVTGGSAGGHLAALAALTANDPDYQPGFEDADTTVQAAVPFYGIYDLAGVTGKAALRVRNVFLGPRVFKRNPKQDIVPFEKASPLLRVNPEAPPFYVIHGVNDTLAPVQQARLFVEALRKTSGAAVAYTELTGTQHAFDVFPSLRSQHSVRGVERFLRWAHDSWRGVSTTSDSAVESIDPMQADLADSGVEA